MRRDVMWVLWVMRVVWVTWERRVRWVMWERKVMWERWVMWERRVKHVRRVTPGGSAEWRRSVMSVLRRWMARPGKPGVPEWISVH